MTLQEWREAQFNTFALPGGLDIRVRRVDIKQIALAGDIPTPLMGLAQQVERGETGGKSELDLLQEMRPYIHFLLRAAIVSPPVADEPSDTHITLGEIPGSVQVEIFNWLLHEVAALSLFRAEQRVAPNV